MENRAEENIQIKDIKQVDSRTLAILWTDNRDCRYDVVDLRRRCPCAACIDEWTKKPILNPEDVSEDVRPVNIHSIGRYAIGISFSDGHSSGIYSFRYLRHLNR